MTDGTDISISLIHNPIDSSLLLFNFFFFSASLARKCYSYGGSGGIDPCCHWTINALIMGLLGQWGPHMSRATRTSTAHVLHMYLLDEAWLKYHPANLHLHFLLTKLGWKWPTWICRQAALDCDDSEGRFGKRVGSCDRHAFFIESPRGIKEVWIVIGGGDLGPS